MGADPDPEWDTKGASPPLRDAVGNLTQASDPVFQTWRGGGGVGGLLECIASSSAQAPQ
jgi:hypothetical protein